MNLGANIRGARKKAGITQLELAERLKVYQKDISRWENGKYVPGVDTISEICRALNVSADILLETGINKNEESKAI